MKRNIPIYILLAAALLWSGCHKEGEPIAVERDQQVYLRATTEGHDTTRAPYEYTTPNESADGVLHAAIWASSFTDKTSFWFPNSGLTGKNGTGDNAHQVAIHATADFDSGDPQLLDQAVYPQKGTPVYFVGMHPQQGWTTDNEAKKADFTFNGSHDVMFAPCVEGAYASTSTDENLIFDVPELKFWHLLTLLKVRIIAEEEQVTSAWGKITSMTITSENPTNHVSIDISQEADNYLAADGKINLERATFSETDGFLGTFPLYKSGSDEVFPAEGGYQMQYISDKVTAPIEVAYVMCSPVEAKAQHTIEGEDVAYPEYMLHITTERRVVTLPIDLRQNTTEFFTGSTRGKSFTLNLTFKMGNAIVVTANVEDWRYGGGGSADVEY